ncbi:MAG: Trm112 family protein [Candidatus Marinimicrobia bacterium]|nr:Trm112 family protein [Candidatus Neomarinimicrobiota bacterium]
MSIAVELLEILVCPKCKGELLHREDPEQLVCGECRLAYPVKDGIPIMLIDQALEMDTPGNISDMKDC